MKHVCVWIQLHQTADDTGFGDFFSCFSLNRES